MSRRPAVALLLAVVLSGCGSTVQLSSTRTEGLGSPAAATVGSSQAGSSGVTTTGTTGAAPLGSATTTSGSSGGGPAAAASPVAGPVAGPAAVASASGRVTAPIELGFMATNVGNAQQFGLNVGQTYSDKQAYTALVKEYNAHGGLDGRQIVPVYGDTDTASSDWNTQFQAACQNLTQDHHVAAVLGYVFVFLDSFEKCLANNGVPHLYGGYQPGDVQAQKDFPSLVSVAHPTVDGVNETVLTGAMASGRLTTSSKLGILYDGCAHGDRAFTSSTVPFLKAHGLHYEAVYMSCAGGSGDTGSAAAAVKSAELQFAAHGVNVVYVPNAIELLVFMENAESQAYRPSYLNQGGGAAFEAQGNAIPRAQLRNVHGYGWMPGIDVGATHQPYAATPQQTACLAKLRHQGLVPQAYNDFMFAYVTCDALDLYAKALALTGGRSDAHEVEQALLKVMPSFRGAATYDGAFGVSTAQRGGPAHYRETGWDDACTCFTYRGPVRTVPTS